MKKKYICLFFFISVISLSAQDITDFFVSLPESYLNQLSKDQRLELITKVKNRKDSTVINNYGGKSELLVLNIENNYMKIRTSSQGFMEIKKWTLPDFSELYAMSFWVCSPVCDGGIVFSDKNYIQVMTERDKFPEIGIIDFINKDSLSPKTDMTEEKIKNKFDIFFIRFELVENGNNIIVINDNEKYMNKEDFNELKPYLKGNRLNLIWRNGSFEKGDVYFE